MSFCTIRGFKRLTAQQIFDMSAQHLLKQKERSMSDLGCGDVCTYLDLTSGRQCAAGIFLDKKKVGKCEGMMWNVLIEMDLVPAHERDLMSSLQFIHDVRHPEQWYSALMDVAKDFNLSTAALN